MTYTDRDVETDHGPEVEATDARQGRWGRHMLWVLLAGLLLVVIALFGTWASRSGDLEAVDYKSRAIAAQAEACRFNDDNVYGLSDPVGAPAANVALSERRAETVTTELARLGFTEVTFKLVAGGETGAVMPTGDVEPLRRRVDIIFGARR